MDACAGLLSSPLHTSPLIHSQQMIMEKVFVTTTRFVTNLSVLYRAELAEIRMDSSVFGKLLLREAEQNPRQLWSSTSVEPAEAPAQQTLH